MAMSAEGEGRGKLILFGEHAVVYGVPAIVAGLPLGARAQVVLLDEGPSRLCLIDPDSDRPLAVCDESHADQPLAQALSAILAAFGDEVAVDARVYIDIPAGAGLGSSAALAAAIARALAALLDRPSAVQAAVAASEAIFHGDASGIDQAAALSGGLFRFTRGADQPIRPIHAPGVPVSICLAGASAPTAHMVRGVAARRARHRPVFEHIERLIGAVTADAQIALSQGDWPRLGELLDINHGALCALGVSTQDLDHACHIARGCGALGAKLTGSGGGGCVFALTPGTSEAVVEAWRARGWRAFSVVLGG